MKKQSKRKGFTIVELIVVMAIIAVLILIAVPTLTKYLDDANATSELGSASAIYKSAIASGLSESLDGDITVNEAISPTGDLVTSITEGVSNSFEDGDIVVRTYVDGSEPKAADGDETTWYVYYQASNSGDADKDIIDPSQDIYLVSPNVDDERNLYKNGALAQTQTP